MSGRSWVVSGVRISRQEMGDGRVWLDVCRSFVRKK